MVLIIVMMIATLLLVALTAALPSVYQEGQREREAETLFRGKQYAIAVALFHRKFNRYPVSIKELMGTNGMRFLRKQYTDPLDPKGKWRFIHANAAGVMIDSKNQPMNPNSPNSRNPAGLGTANTPIGETSPVGGMIQTAQQSSFGGPGQSILSPQPGQTNPQSPSAFFGSGNEVQGAFIVGVAPTSHRQSIRIWNKHQHYDEWEFTGIDLGIFGIQVGTPGGSSGPMGPMQQPLQQGIGSPQGTTSPLISPLGAAPPSN
jgi:hypothetical protein